MNEFSLECFIAVADLGSFTKAAIRVNRTQSAVTQQIGNLERRLETLLFHREKKVTLTKQGELFLPYALRIHGLYKEVVDQFKNPELDGEVRVGVPEDFATLFLADVLVNFSRIHPRIFLNVKCDLTLNLMNQFKNGTLDLAIVKLSSPEEFPHGVEIWKEPLVWVGKSEVINLIKAEDPLPLVLSPEPCVYRSKAMHALEKENLPSRIVYTSPSYAGIIAAVKANMGITALPITMIPDQLERIVSPRLPILPDIHVSLLMQREKQSDVTENLSQFLLKKLLRR
jgi:DNA-binding transcriptional LysR family regulator